MKARLCCCPITLLTVAALAGKECPLNAQERPHNAQTLEPSDTAGNRGKIASSIGVLVAQHYGEQDTVRFFNEDGSIWYKFTFYYDDSDGKWDYPNANFDPRAFHPDNFLLALDVIEVRGERYSVVVNVETGLRKWMKKAPFLRLLTWDQYILTAFSVAFNPVDNPVRVSPQPSAEVIRFVDDTDYRPEAVQGDWLKVKWGQEGAENHGWIRWKSGSRLLVTMYPFA